MADKGFKTIDEQIALLQSRGLRIDDLSKARDFLLRNNYYRVSGYSLTLRNHDHFSSKATFQNIMDIYQFDHELRHVLMTYIDVIEVTMKSVYVYEFTKVYGPLGHRDVSHFNDANQHAKILQKADEQCDRRHRHEAYIKHFIDDLQQDLPFWAYVDLMTISDISILYSISESAIKKAVAAHFGLTMKRSDEILQNFMKGMTIIRNLCAHGSRLYNRLFEQKPSLNKDEKALLLQKADGTIDNAHLYGFVLIMRRLLKPDDFSTMKNAISLLVQKYPFVRMSYYGFRDDWQKML